MSTTLVEPDDAEALIEPGIETEAAETEAPPVNHDTIWLEPRTEDTDHDEIGRPAGQPVYAAFCFEEADSFIGSYAAQAVAALADSGVSVHLFARDPFDVDEPAVRTHAVGNCWSEDLLGSVGEYTRRAVNAFLRQFPAGSENITLLGFEWSSVSVVSLLHAIRNFPAVVSFHSLEWERSDMNGPTSWHISQTELTALREARTIIIHRPATAKIARRHVPECAARLADAPTFFPALASQA